MFIMNTNNQINICFIPLDYEQQFNYEFLSKKDLNEYSIL